MKPTANQALIYTNYFILIFRQNLCTYIFHWVDISPTRSVFVFSLSFGRHFTSFGKSAVIYEINDSKAA